ncbi:IS3 family transposase [Candidatus Berkiella cookevillensis]|uniref:Transposase n=1 Tax=Candidatus Berkiella cookevillensis TaxID=437022 RepID=A0A0Q9Y8W5_9GAMM|nr:IS3 family transposase [Candidatus Berkiella cookevillensis]MCS5708806.1 IS3 family transposase [Candidatus Berkiella cookevillensis]
MGRRAFTPEFRNESASLVLDEGYTAKEAANTVGIGLSTMERWVSQLKKERQGVPPTKGKAITSEQRRIQELEAKIRKIEREKEILKKATALLMSESLNQ